jgi:hypothetical protein
MDNNIKYIEKELKNQDCFYDLVAEILESHFMGSLSEDSKDGTYVKYLYTICCNELGGFSKKKASIWLEGRLANFFPAIHERPKWLGKPAWPFCDGRPMTFIVQTSITVEESDKYIFRYPESITAGRDPKSLTEVTQVYLFAGYENVNENTKRRVFRAVYQVAGVHDLDGKIPNDAQVIQVVKGFEDF